MTNMTEHPQQNHTGPARKIISFTLFGTREIFLNGALKNLESAKKYYPDWQCWFYVSQELPQQFLDKLENAGGKVIRKIRRSRYDGMLWRLLAANEKGIDAVIFRDLDSRFSEREAAAVNDWLESGKSFHIMRDHPWHKSLIMGGMWGVRGNILPDIHVLFRKFCWRNPDLFLYRKGIFGDRDLDQHFLGQMVYPLSKNKALIHTEFVCYPGEVIKPFPLPRKNNEFIGQIVENDVPKDPIDLDSRAFPLKTIPFPDYRSCPRFFRRVKNFLRRISGFPKQES